MKSLEIIKDRNNYKLIGAIDENSNIEGFFTSLEEDSIIDLSEVSRISSIGVRYWVAGRIGCKSKLNYIKCPVQVIEQFSMVPELLSPNITISSFYAPYFCYECDTEHNELLIKGKQYELGFDIMIPVITCECGEESEFEGEANYFAFINDYKNLRSSSREISIAPRTKFNEEVLIKIVNSSEYMYLTAENISEGGMYLQCKQRLDNKNELLIEFRVPGSMKRLSLKAKICWYSEDAPQRKFKKQGFGVKFPEINQEDKETILEYVSLNKV